MNAAILLFASKGFNSTTTREICKHAGVNLSLISYYFKTKEGLYTSIIESIINYGLEYLQDELNLCKDIKLMDKSEKIDLYRKILEKYVNFLYSESVPSSFVILMLKEQTNSNSKFSDMYAKKIEILYSALRRLLASILNKKENDKFIIFEVSSIIGQILSFKIMTRATLFALNQVSYTKDDSKRIISIATSHIQTNLNALGLK